MSVATVFKGLSERFDSLTLRERVMLLLLLLATLGGAWLNLVWYPATQHQKQLLEGNDQIREQIQLLDVRLRGMVVQATDDPNRKIRLELERIREQVARMEGEIKGTTDSLLAPGEMSRLLEQMLLRQNGIEMIRLNTLRSEPLVTTSEAGAVEEGVTGAVKEAASKSIYRHGFLIEFEGEFNSVLDYLKTLEDLPSSFFWDGVELGVSDYPLIRVKLRLHTLSLSEGWIGV
ncbi:MAG: hypothetical protein OQL28_04315 [Sedimenticola sp.]|nr:hypothetical protein [Sedimenticola sp.]